jgi:hypothetical protein
VSTEVEIRIPVTLLGRLSGYIVTFIGFTNGTASIACNNETSSVLDAVLSKRFVAYYSGTFVQ